MAADLQVRSVNLRSCASGSSLFSLEKVIQRSIPCSSIVCKTNFSFFLRNCIRRGELASFTVERAQRRTYRFAHENKRRTRVTSTMKSLIPLDSQTSETIRLIHSHH